MIDGCLGTTEVTDVPERFGSEHDWRGVAAGFMHALALKADGSLWGWGRNYSGQLARPASTDLIPAPTQIGAQTDWSQISVGAGHCLALKTNGSLWAWGQNDCGQVGDGTTNNAFSPKMIGSANDWKAIAAGAFSSYTLKRDHSLWGWAGADFDSRQDSTFRNALKGSPLGESIQEQIGRSCSSVHSSSFIRRVKTYTPFLARPRLLRPRSVIQKPIAASAV